MAVRSIGKETQMVETARAAAAAGKNTVVLCPSEKRVKELEARYSPIKGVEFLYWKTYVQSLEGGRKTGGLT